MLSFNNQQAKNERYTDHQQRFAIKKLTVGVASVLVGFSFMGVSAFADQQVGSTPATPAEQPVAAPQQSAAPATSAQPTNTPQPTAAPQSVPVHAVPTSGGGTNAQPAALDPSVINSWNYDIYQDTAHMNGGGLWGWGTSHNAQDVIIDSYKGNDVTGKDLIVPNAADLRQAGIITDPNAKVYVNPATFEGTKAANSITISGTNGEKAYAVPGNWDQGFGSGNAKYTKLDLTNLDVSAVQGMNGMFEQNSHLTQLIGLDTWDMRNVKSTEAMFRGDSGLTNLDLSNWNLDSVETAHSMFENCTKLQSVGNVANWHFSHAQNLSNLFYGDTTLTSIDGLDAWQTGNVTNMVNVFSGSGLRDILTIANWDVRNVNTMNNMFSNMQQLQHVDLSGWHTNSLTDMSLMFMLDRNLSSITGLANLDTSKVTNMYCLFYLTQKLTDLTGISDWDTANVTNMGLMFAINGAGKLDLHQWNFDHVNNVGSMFQYMTNPATIILDAQHPTLTSFTGTDFRGGRPLVVISTTPAILDLNQATTTYTYVRPDGTRYIQDVIGRHNSNYLMLAIKTSENATPENIIQIPMDYVYRDPDAVYAAVNQAISVNHIKSLLQNYDRQHNTHLADQWNQAADTDSGELKSSIKQFLTLFTTDQARATLPAQVTGRYILTMYKSEPVTPTPVYDYVHIKYVDKNDPSHVLKTSSVIGEVGHAVEVDTAIKDNVPTNWKIDPAFVIPTTANVLDTIQVPIVHDTKTIQPTDPTDHDQQDLFKAVTRTINVHKPDGTVDPHLEFVNYQRTKLVDLVTNQVLSYGDWELVPGSNSNWPEFAVPQIDGYTSLVDNAKATAVPEVQVNADSPDQTMEVTYVQNQQPQQPSDHDQGKPQKPGHDQPQAPNKGQHGNGAMSVKPVQQGQSLKTNTASPAKHDQGQALPQTGAKDQSLLALAGLGLTASLGMFGLANRKRD